MKYVCGASYSDEISIREQENKKTAYEAALEGIVLLKNENSVLPLKKGKIAVFGTGAVLTVKGGTGSGEVNERHSVTILEGMENAGFEITTMKWLDDCKKEYDVMKENYSKMMSKLNLTQLMNSMNTIEGLSLPYGRLIDDSDLGETTDETVIYVVARQAGEGADKKIEKGEFDLSEIEISNLKFLKNHYKNLILVINSGSYMNVSILDEIDIQGGLVCAQQGTEGGNAFADLILGKVSPSGKLVDTWVKKYADIPCGDEYSYRSGDTTQEYYKEGIYVGYRYADTYKVEPRFHFGFGLSYTDFDIITDKVSYENEKVNIQAEVINKGKFVGKETLQVYVSCPNGKLLKEYQRLVSFDKTSLLKPGDKEVLELCFDLSYLTSYDEESASYILEKGKYIIKIGNASNALKNVAVLNLEDDIVYRKVKNISPLKKPFEEITPLKNEEYGDISGLSVFNISKNDVKTKVQEYLEPEVYHDEKVDAVMKKLTTKDMIDLCVGTSIQGMFNTKNVVCPGSVGMTTCNLVKKGLINANLCDGPAGIRILKRSAIRKHGILKLKMQDYLMSFMEYFPKWLKRILNPNKKDKILYQFTTAFPVGTSLAQTWNQKLVEKVGKAVSVEMEEYNVTYWLAPAMNIHRNPLCGRNFEYFSEDPVVTGKIAAAMTRGVQATKGNYVTIKHFACNNQEDNRNKSSSNVHERALREIYLRGFEIAVKEASPKSVMTSYNMLNGIYTANSYDLITNVLRNEWGFDGIVMTDWYATGLDEVTKVQLGRDDVAIDVGNDMIMPGGKYNKKVIKKAIRNKTLSKEKLERAAANIIKEILESKMNSKYPPETFK